MYAARLILIAVAAVTFVPEARAVNQVWWEAVPLNASSSVSSQGIGQTLALECAGNPAGCAWDVTMFLANDETLFSWASDLAIVEPTLHVTAFQYETWISGKIGNFYPFDDPNLNTVVNGGIHDASARTAFFNGAYPYSQSYYGVPYALFSFTLEKLEGASWTPGWSQVTTFTSGWQWTGANPEVWVQFGANSAINAAPIGAAPAMSVISVWVPEPASAALVGVAVVCLVWRVRGRVSCRRRSG